MSDLSSRRDFLKSAALWPLAATVAGTGFGTASALANVDPIKRTGGSMLKVSCNAYSFAKQLNDRLLGRGPGMTLLELAEFCAQQNFDGFDPTGYYFPGYRDRKIPEDKIIFELKKRAFELGLGISGTGTANNFTVADKAARAKD